MRSAFQNPCCNLSHGKSDTVGSVLGSLEAESETGICIKWLTEGEREAGKGRGGCEQGCVSVKSSPGSDS